MHSVRDEGDGCVGCTGAFDGHGCVRVQGHVMGVLCDGDMTDVLVVQVNDIGK